MTSHSYKSIRTGAFLTRSVRRRTGEDDTDEMCSDSSVTSSISSVSASGCVSITVAGVDAVDCWVVLSGRVNTSVLDGLNVSRVASKCCHPHSERHTSYWRSPLRPTTLARSDHPRRLGSFTRTVSCGCNTFNSFLLNSVFAHVTKTLKTTITPLY